MRTRSQAVQRQLNYLLDGVPELPADDSFAQLGSWLDESRFAAFAEANRDKIRKKLRVASEPAARGDVVSELQTAFLLLADRRIDLAFEAYGSGQRGPDFTVTFRAAHRFNLEVTRPRVRAEGSDAQAGIGNAVLAKLRQLPADAPNAVLVAAGLAATGDEVALAMRALKVRADGREEEFFAGRGMSTSEFQRQYRRLAAVLVGSATGDGVQVWENREVRRRLPEGAARALSECLGNGRSAVRSPTPEVRQPDGFPR